MSFENSTGTAMGTGAMPCSYYSSEKEMVRNMMCRVPDSSDDRDYFHMQALAWERGFNRRSTAIRKRINISNSQVAVYPPPKRYHFPRAIPI